MELNINREWLLEVRRQPWQYSSVFEALIALCFIVAVLVVNNGLVEWSCCINLLPYLCVVAAESDVDIGKLKKKVKAAQVSWDGWAIKVCDSGFCCCGRSPRNRSGQSKHTSCTLGTTCSYMHHMCAQSLLYSLNCFINKILYCTSHMTTKILSILPLIGYCLI